MLLALSSSQKLGIALVAAAFVTFALVSAVVVPRYRPEFPGRHAGWFVAVSALFTVAMLTTIFVVARETGGEATAAETTTTMPESTASEPQTTESSPPGDAAAGKALFASNCAACHTFTPAGSTGTAGPDLDNLAADAQKANRGSLDAYTTESIADPNAYVVPGFQPNVMPPFGSTLKPSEIADLVAFLAQQG